MLRTLDRYIIRETLAPFGLTLLILTFLLQIPTIMDVAEKLIAKGVTLPIIGRIVLTLLPSSLAITIPISLLVGLLMALGRLSADREAVAMQACGVSLYRILRPVLLMARDRDGRHRLHHDGGDAAGQSDVPRHHLPDHPGQGRERRAAARLLRGVPQPRPVRA